MAESPKQVQDLVSVWLVGLDSGGLPIMRSCQFGDLLEVIGASPASHQHEMADVNGLDEALAGINSRIDALELEIDEPDEPNEPDAIANEHWIFNPDDKFLQDYPWANSRPAGETHTLITGKWPNFVGALEFAPGQGRNGKNAFKMTTGGQTQGDPAFWIIPMVTTGGSIAEPTGDNNFIVPPTKRANRMEAWFRFPPGYRKRFAAALDYYSSTFHWGTYTTYPAGDGGGFADGSLTMGEEAQNWHWYHESRVRWDWLEDNEWVRITCHALPMHLRGDNGRNNYPKDPTMPHGEYFHCLTRSYFEFPPAWWRVDNNTNPSGIANLPEIPTPYSIYCDSIRFYWRDEYLPVEIRFGANGDWLDGQEYECQPAPAVTDIPFRVTNVTSSPVTGRLAFRGRSIQWSPLIVDQASGSKFPVAMYTIAAGETKHFWLRVSPAADESQITTGFANSMGIVFEPASELIPNGPVVDTPWGANMLNKTSSRVETSAYHGVGGSDYDVCGRGIGVVKSSGGNATYRPTSIGAQTYRVKKSVSSQFQIPGHSPGGGTLTFEKGTSQADKGTLAISPSGQVTYTPPSSEWTGTCHFSYRINGNTTKPSLWYGAWVHVS